MTSSVPCVLAQWDLGKDLQNWALSKQGSHRTILPCLWWWEEGSYLAAGELSLGSFCLTSDLQGKKGPHLLTPGRGAGGEEAAWREEPCLSADAVTSSSFSLFFTFFWFALSLKEGEWEELEHALGIFSLVCAAKARLMPWGEVIRLKSLWGYHESVLLWAWKEQAFKSLWREREK